MGRRTTCLEAIVEVPRLIDNKQLNTSSRTKNMMVFSLRMKTEEFVKFPDSVVP